MPSFLLRITAACLNSIYRHHCKRQDRRSMVLFVSRQTDTASFDYTQLAHQVRTAGWEAVLLVRKVRIRNLPSYCLHVLHQLKLMAQAHTVVIDRYDPVISLLDLAEEEPAGARGTQHAHAAKTGIPLYSEFPTSPVIVQIWHAFGAFKHFGFQSIDTPEGHPRDFFEKWHIHRNCTWVVCSGEACRTSYAQAFNIPIEHVVCAARPEYFELASLQETQGRKELCIQAGGSDTPTVLMAPTLRYNATSPHPIKDLHEQSQNMEGLLGARVLWSFHPLEEGNSAPGNVSEELLEADAVVTDYSSLVYEAYLLKKPVAFYVPDIEQFRTSPGLNIDPTHACPSLCARTIEELACLVQKMCTPEGRLWALEQITPIMEGAFLENPDPDALARLLMGKSPDNARTSDTPSSDTAPTII